MTRWLSGILRLFPLLLLPLVPACTGSSGNPAVPVSQGSYPDYRSSKAEVVVLNFFDMYCHTCQTMAPHSKELYQMVRSRGLGGRVEFYAIGWGNTPLESEQYRQRFHVSYPVIPDRERVIAKRFGKFRPPLMIVLRRQGGQWVEKDRIVDLRGDKEALFARISP